MLDASITAFHHLFSLGPLLAVILVVPVAVVSGMMPGGGLPFVVIILGFADQLGTYVGMALMVGYVAAHLMTEAVPSILMGIPGARASQATVLDGYPMARKGLAGVALGSTYTSSLIAGILGALVLLAILPLARDVLRIFGSAEFFLLEFLGIAAVAIVSAGALTKGLLTATFGLLVALIGFSPINGVVRATFGIDYLWNGISIIPVVIGIFALPELIDLVVGNTPIAKERMEEMLREANRDVYRGMREAFKHKWLIVRSSLIGLFVGAMPALGAAPAHWLAYAQARQTEKGASETFGTGDIRGVIAPECGSNATTGGELIPTLIFGIPGSAGMAILLGYLVLTGVQPGPAMLTRHLDLTLFLVFVIIICHILVVPIMLRFAPWLTRVAAVPPNVLAPVVIAMVTLAAYQSNFSMGDLMVVGAFGVLGLFMKAYGWPRPPILIAVVLAQSLEKYLWLSINTYGASMLERPQFLGIIAVVAVAIFFALRVRASVGAAARQAAVREAEGAEQ